MTNNELREKRASVWSEMRGLLDETETNGMSAEDSEKYGRMEAEFDRLTKDLDARERAAQYEERLAQPQGTPKGVQEAIQPFVDEKRTYDKAFRKWLANGNDMLSGEERSALYNGYKPELRALAAGTTTAGGYTVPEGFRNQIIETMLTFGGMRNVAEVISTPTGNAILWPTNDDTGNVGAIVGENVAVTEQDVSFGTAQLGAYLYSSKMVRASFQFLQDTGINNVEGWLGGKLAERVARIQNTHFTVGTGTGQPQGIQPTAPVGVTLGTGNTTTVTADGLIDLIHSLDPAYRVNARFMMNDATVSGVRKLKDTTNQYIWQPGMQAGSPDSLFGYPIVVNQDMPAPAASVKSVLFGDFRRAYVIRDVADFQLMRLNERYADFHQVAFLGFARADGLIQDTNAYAALVQSAT